MSLLLDANLIDDNEYLEILDNAKELTICTKEYLRKLSILHLLYIYNSFNKNYKIFETTRFNHTMIFNKLIDHYKLSDTYISHNNCPGHILIT